MRRELALLTIFLVSACVLAFEVALTRVCSVLLQYHVSFAVVSMAVLGVGLGGFLGYALARRDPERAGPVADAAILALSPALLAALATLMLLPFAAHWPLLLFLVLPVFTAAGAFQSLLLRSLAARAGWLYAADLAGGALGAILAVVALDALGGPVNAALVLAVLAAGVAWLWTRGRGAAGRAAPVLLGVALAVVVAQRSTGFLDVRYERAPGKLIHRMMQPAPEGVPVLVPALERWDAYSRVDVLDLDTPRGVQRLVFIDGETPTRMLPVDAATPGAAGHQEALSALPFRLLRPGDVLSIGSGGGYDVVLSRVFGARRVDAVELNAGVLDVAQAARRFTGDIYHQPGVRLHHAEGRQFARGAAPASYDLVILALAQSLAGNLREYALSENYLYTREAFADYLRALRPDGTLALLVDNEILMRKLVRTAFEVLAARGLEPGRCVAALARPREVPYSHLVLVRATPFTPPQAAALAAEVGAHDYRAVHLPAGGEAPAAGEAAPRLSAADLEGGAHPRLGPASDDRPFFFNIQGGMPPALGTLLGVTAGLLAAGIVGLAWLSRSRAARAAGGRPVANAAVGVPAANTAVGGSAARALCLGGYFVALGLAFMMVEVLVLQKTLLVLGFPTLNLGVVLATFLVAAGCGSAASTRLVRRRARLRLRLVLLALGLTLPALVPLLGALHAALGTLSLAARCAALCACLFPFGFAMGMPFPCGVRLLRREATPLIPWFWGLNGVASIVGSALLIAVVLQVGFRIAALLPAALYLGAIGLASGLEAETRSEPAPVRGAPAS